MKRLVPILFLPVAGFSLLIEPWFTEPWEFELDTSFTYSRYSHVAQALHPLKHTSNDYMVAFDLSVTPVTEMAGDANWSMDIDLELVETPRQSFGFRSAAAQIRYLWTDDVMGDFASIASGVSLRGVSHASLADVSCPYHSYADLELNTSIGKEWDRGRYWVARTFGYIAIGQANRGYPWWRAHLAVQGDGQDKYKYQVFVDSYFGLGPQKHPNIEDFHGYAFIQHRSIDIGTTFAYIFDIWGSITVGYVYRAYAHSFPAHTNFVSICYRLPFSLF